MANADPAPRISEAVSHELANAQLTTAEGAPFRLGDAWATRTVVLAWVRHFG